MAMMRDDSILLHSTDAISRLANGKSASRLASCRSSPQTSLKNWRQGKKSKLESMHTRMHQHRRQAFFAKTSFSVTVSVGSERKVCGCLDLKDVRRRTQPVINPRTGAPHTHTQIKQIASFLSHTTQAQASVFLSLIAF